MIILKKLLYVLLLLPFRSPFFLLMRPLELNHLIKIITSPAVADAIKTSLGPRGMDKMIQDGKGEVTITNDGATILKQMKLLHPAAKMLVELSQAQDAEAGDGTTSVVILAGESVVKGTVDDRRMVQ